MKYVGGKSAQAKYYLPQITKILENFGEVDTFYFEPFLGGGNIFCKVESNNLKQRFGFDVDQELISLWEYLRDNPFVEELIPINKGIYQDVKNNPGNYPDYYRAFVSIGCSFRGKKWGGYAGDTFDKKTGKTRKYSEEGVKRIKKDALLLHPDDVFINQSYLEIPLESIPENSLIYCDPPYFETQEYFHQQFDHREFWNWVSKVSKRKNTKVLVSEFTLPSELKFNILVEKTKNISLALRPKSRTEYLIEVLP